jgi:hypothetical protein
MVGKEGIFTIMIVLLPNWRPCLAGDSQTGVRRDILLIELIVSIRKLKKNEFINFK